MSAFQNKLKLFVLTGSSSHSHIVINSLREAAEVYNIRIENDFQRMNEGRLKRYGIIKGIGQKLFIKFKKRLKNRSQKRIYDIYDEFNLDDTTAPPDLTVPDVHDARLLKTIRSLNADMVVLNCVSILPQSILDATKVPFINVHGGITPLYRGVFGGYWALREGNAHLVGSTVHRVDAGTDTGAILKQICFSITPDDNFCTYNTLHLAYGLKGLHQVIDYYIEHNQLPEPIQTDMPSKLRCHPTLFGYLFYRLFKGVK